ncbi:MAG TPA: ABC transporter permease [Desulfatiglandales bacterium]|nr:ABC transporter permease [Desulfatiglandales bacterium]
MSYVLKRCWQAIIVVLGVTTITFILLQASGDPITVLLSPEATKEDIENLRKVMGLDKPLPVQYFKFMKRTIRGDFGESYMLREDAFKLVMERLPATIELAVGGTVFAIIVAIPLGIFAAIKRYTIYDNFCMVLAVSGQAIPLFWLALMLMIFFSIHLGWLPVSGRGGFSHLIMPSVTLGVYMAPITMRLIRSGMIDVFEKNFIQTARAKGLPESKVILKHALKNVMIPVSTVLAMQFGRMIGGAVVTETVFAWPGVGRLAVKSIMDVDFPTVQAAVFVMAIVIVSVNLFADILITFIDPRVSYD